MENQWGMMDFTFGLHLTCVLDDFSSALWINMKTFICCFQWHDCHKIKHIKSKFKSWFHVFSPAGAFLAENNCRCFWVQLALRNVSFVLWICKTAEHKIIHYYTSDLKLTAICCINNVAWVNVGQAIVMMQIRFHATPCLSSCRAFFPGVDVRRQPGDSSLQPRRSRVQETTPVRLPRRQRSHIH